MYTYETYDLRTGATIQGGYERPEAAVDDEDACAILGDEFLDYPEYSGRPFGVRPERDIAEIAPDPDGWNVWRWRDPDDGSTAYCVGNAASATEARTLAMRLGAHQIQHGLDGDVEGT